MREQTSRLIDKMRSLGIDIYLITDCDDHMSEYTSAHFHAMAEFSGFAGCCGRMAVTAEGEAALWTDGRYFLAAEKDLEGSGIALMRMGEPGVPAVSDWIREHMPQGGTISFDGTCMPMREGRELLIKLGSPSYISADLCGELWDKRPAEEFHPLWVLDEKYCGESALSKISKLRDRMKKLGASSHVMASLDDIAWLLNLRGSDIPYNPVFASYLLIKGYEILLYIDDAHLADGPVRAYLSGIGVGMRPYGGIYEDIRHISGSILIDPARCNYELAASVPQDVRIIESMNPAAAMKCRKNSTEISSLHAAQHKDSIALTRFMYWFKTHVSSGELTERSAAEKLHEFRSAQPGFFDESFETISAYGSNAAMVHYEAAPGSEDVYIKPQSLYLVDSGGQYPEGTTDVTRTWACGPVSDDEKRDFTLVAVAGLRLAAASFPEGVSGTVLDGIAREVLWKRGIDYNHGTGHGVGFCLNVHEAPAGIRCRVSTAEGAYPMYEGMYVSDEPGIYVTGRYGIRTENLLMVRHDFSNEFGRFMRFEIMNFCPIDRDCIDTGYMEERDIALLNEYHSRVYSELEGDMDERERKWLAYMCAPVRREQAEL